MARRTQADMQKTRVTLLQTARKVFTAHGFNATSMDDLTAQAGLTRGALYHHFGDKKSLFQAVIIEIDQEMDQRLQQITAQHTDPWQGFLQRCIHFLEMALEPEIQRLILEDARAVLGQQSLDAQQYCISSIENILTTLMKQQIIKHMDCTALARFIHGSLNEAAFWIAQSQDGQQTLAQSIDVLTQLLIGLRLDQTASASRASK
ncbi:TetR/AcrR family transcriptional regulator [Acinetobacter larvae]|uniref:TetR family transcriptional regulator n=1 Tax=Acinetobacter larvae TaxID=1789224 RepID=A0A1B2M3K5_9GAMM|nr:TetR/AcrR family transcriptional regulator [Acinetobacter larvae]AOA59787.1 TetR family transcriptional regulator [Acinetobacter larvae]